MPGVSVHSDKGFPADVPPWLVDFLKSSYFVSCKSHAAAHKSERNFFCVDCGGESLCSLCVQKGHSGPGHSILQVRRSSYHEAVRSADIARLIDTAQIQVYVINGAKIFFLNGRPQAKPQKGAPFYCETCHRTLPEAYRFCSIGCKLTGASKDSALSFHPRVHTASHPGLHADDSGDTGPKRIPNHRKRPCPPLIIDGGISQDNSSDDSGREVESRVTYKKRKPLYAGVEKASDLPPLSPPTSSYMPPTTPPQHLSEFAWRAHRRKGLPHRAPLW